MQKVLVLLTKKQFLLLYWKVENFWSKSENNLGQSIYSGSDIQDFCNKNENILVKGKVEIFSVKLSTF